LLQALPATTETHALLVRVQSGKRQTPVAIRLVVRRRTPEATEAAHKHLRRQASRKQTTLDDRRLVAAGFLVLATSLPGDEFPAAEVLAVYRLRWQIELAFKRLKSLLHIDKIRTTTEAGTRCWLYAHLIVALLCDDLSQDVLESFPSGAARGRGDKLALASDTTRPRSPDRSHRAADLARQTQGRVGIGQPAQAPGQCETTA
jgi:hypothetical protein